MEISARTSSRWRFSVKRTKERAQKKQEACSAHASRVQQSLCDGVSSRFRGAWRTGVQAGSAGEPGELLEGLRHARSERAEIRAFRRRQGDDGRAARARHRADKGDAGEARGWGKCEGG